jgi:homoserine kinase type II
MVIELLHSDYTRPNLLFQGTSLVGVLDLKGIPGYAVWELGKLAFDPRTFVSRRDWLAIALTTIAAYQSRRRRADVVAAARTAVIYHLCSLWGISDRYDGSHRAVPTGYEDYWLDRHALTGGLLASLEDLEARLPYC